MELEWGDKEAEPQRPPDRGGCDPLQVDGCTSDENLEEADQTNQLDQTGFLLHQLQQLKMWQKEQEMKLMLEQREEMERMKAEGIHGEFDSINDDDDDDDATIDQDVSSLTSYEETPRNEPSSRNQTKLGSHQNRTPSNFRVPQPIFELSGPSLAIQNTESDHSQDPQTIFPRNLGSNPRKTKAGVKELDGPGQEKSAIPNPEEKPICAPNKSFEELLAEQLGLGVDKIQRNNDLSVPERKNGDSKGSKARSFLRKGSGLARYGGVGSPPKAFHRSKSQSNVNNDPNDKKSNGGKSQNRLKSSKSCSKLDIAERETIAFTSKKRAGVASATKSMCSQSATSVQKLHSKKASQNFAEERYRQASPLHDSVELSFREKLKKSGEKQRQEMEDLSAFERLEEAAWDSSFCSSSSKVQHLLKDLKMPSPILKPQQSGSKGSKSVTSTPKPVMSHHNNKGREEGAEENLSLDIQNFFVKRGAMLMSEEGTITEEEDATETPNLSLSGEDDLSNPLSIGKMSPKEEQIDEWDSLEDDNESFDDQKRTKSSNKHGKNMKRYVPMKFSPPKIPQNAASFDVWNIFSKERSEEQKSKSKKNGKVCHDKKKSKTLLKEPKDLDFNYENVLLNAKLTELSHEIDKFKKESLELSQMKRKLHNDRKKLAQQIETFEKEKETEKKKNEEEKRRLKRDRSLLEKAKRDKRVGEGQRLEVEKEELQSKIVNLQEEYQRKESKWTASINKLHEQLKYYERENRILHEENHKLKLKHVTPKVSTHLTDRKKNSSAHVVSLANGYKQQPTQQGAALEVMSPDSINVAGSASQTSTPVSERVPVSIPNDKQSIIKASEPTPIELISTPRMNFSPADSLDSSMTLVSCSVAETESVKKNQALPVLKSIIRNEAKGITEKLYDDGSSEFAYANGDRKLVSPGGKTTKVFYYNGDIKETLETGIVKYFYFQSRTWHFTYPNKKEVLQFENGQEEIRYPDGSLEISFPDSSFKKVAADGSEEMHLADGTRVEVNSSGDKTLYFPNGQKEIHTPEYKRREYPDGSNKTVFNDGRQETRYANGRVRIKNKEGTLLHDSHSDNVDTEPGIPSKT